MTMTWYFQDDQHNTTQERGTPQYKVSLDQEWFHSERFEFGETHLFSSGGDEADNPLSWSGQFRQVPISSSPISI